MRNVWTIALAATALLAACQGGAGGAPAAPPTAHVDGTRLVDDAGRALTLRGINLGGAAKLPNHITNTTQSGALDLDVSFVDRPLPLTTAPEHFARIYDWGMRVLRLNITWDAVAHAGPGTVDQAFLDYLRALIEAAGAAGLAVFVDMHQDVWSRHSGGDGAPAWTLEAAGFDLDKLDATGAAITHARNPDLAYLQWPTNHSKLATATMFTLFWAGDVYAPHVTVPNGAAASLAGAGGESIQQFLQREYVDAFVAVAEAVGDLDAVIGYDLMNEPGVGFIGLHGLGAWDSRLTLGPMPTPAQALFAAEFPQAVTRYEYAGLGFAEAGSTTINPEGQRVWRDGAIDPWRAAGVWDVVDGTPQILIDDYFASRPRGASAAATATGAGAGASAATVPVNLLADFIQPFYVRLAEALHAVDADALMFLEPPAEANDAIEWPADLGIPAVFAPHWYDPLALLTREFNPDLNVRVEPEIELVSGRENVAALFEELIGEIRDRGHDAGLPTLIGEFGLSFDPTVEDDDGYANAADGFGMYYDAMDALGLGAFVWNYQPANTRAFGDGWNLEDLSLVTPRDPEGRALAGYARPYVLAAAGDVVDQAYDAATGVYTVTIAADPALDVPSQIVVPSATYPNGADVDVRGGNAGALRAGQIDLYAEAAEVDLTITRR